MVVFLALEGQILTLFSKIFCKSLLNMPKNIFEIKKTRYLKKFFSPKNCKKGKKNAKIKKGLNILLFFPQRGCVPNFRKFGPSDLEKMRYERTNGQTNKRTDGTEIIGPSGKILGPIVIEICFKKAKKAYFSNLFRHFWPNKIFSQKSGPVTF